MSSTDEPEEVWRCQATDALKATEPLKTSELRAVLARAPKRQLPLSPLPLRVGSRHRDGGRETALGLISRYPLHGPGSIHSPQSRSTCSPASSSGAWPDEIATTLDEKGHHRGLSFDREMLPYCGGTYRVQDRVQRLIDDRTGRMIEIPSDCLILEGVVCSGERSTGRWFCPREIYPYWREAWLRRVANRRLAGRHHVAPERCRRQAGPRLSCSLGRTASGFCDL